MGWPRLGKFIQEFQAANEHMPGSEPLESRLDRGVAQGSSSLHNMSARECLASNHAGRRGENMDFDAVLATVIEWRTQIELQPLPGGAGPRP